MIDKLTAGEEKYNDLERRLSLPEIYSDQKEYHRLIKEYSALTPVITKFREYKKAVADMESAQALLRDSSEPELRELAAEDVIGPAGFCFLGLDFRVLGQAVTIELPFVGPVVVVVIEIGGVNDPAGAGGHSLVVAVVQDAVVLGDGGLEDVLAVAEKVVGEGNAPRDGRLLDGHRVRLDLEVDGYLSLRHHQLVISQMNPYNLDYYYHQNEVHLDDDVVYWLVADEIFLYELK